MDVRRVDRARGGAAGTCLEPGEERVPHRELVVAQIVTRTRDPGVVVPVDSGVEGLSGEPGASLDCMGAEVVAGDGVVAVVRGPDRGGCYRDRAGLDPDRYHQCGFAGLRVQPDEAVRDDVWCRCGGGGETCRRQCGCREDEDSGECELPAATDETTAVGGLAPAPRELVAAQPGSAAVRSLLRCLRALRGTGRGGGSLAEAVATPRSDRCRGRRRASAAPRAYASSASACRSAR